MKAHCSQAYSTLKSLFVRHYHIGEEHVSTSEMEKHLVEDAKHVFLATDRQGTRAPLGRHHPGFRFGL